MKNYRFSVLLPTLVLIVSEALVIAPAVVIYLRFSTSAHGSATVPVGAGFAVPVNDILRHAFYGSAVNVEEPIVILNAPGFLINLLVSGIAPPTSMWFLKQPIWIVASFPVFALPAWIFVGRGIDALTNRAQPRSVDLFASICFGVLLLSTSAVLILGLSETDREGLGGLYLKGFTLWGGLFLIPAIAWLRKERLNTKPQIPE